MLQYFVSAVRAVFCGARGVKEIKRGAETLYIRPGGYFYLTLQNGE